MSRHANADDLILAQIELELRKLNSVMTDEDDKPAIIQRIAELKAMVTPSSTPLTLTPQPATASSLLSEIFAAFRRR